MKSDLIENYFTAYAENENFYNQLDVYANSVMFLEQIIWFFVLFHDILTFISYLMPKPLFVEEL